MVVGDIITIEAGSKIPADCILLEGMDVSCDESMYGQEENVKKKIYSREGFEDNKDPDPFLLSRSLVLSGIGRAVVVAVGERTRWFREHPVEDLEDDNKETPLTEKLKKLAEVIKVYSHIAAFIIFVVLVIYQALNIVFSSKAEFLSHNTIQQLIRSFTTSVAIVIVSVPEGLILSISISGSYSILQMKKHQLLVKNMAASENLGYTEIICTGKTGTITEGNMHVRKYIIGEKTHDYDGGRESFLSHKLSDKI